MKKIKIFAFPAHTNKDRVSGVDYFRIIQPMENLDGFEYKDYKFLVHVYDPLKDETLAWDKVAEEYDLVYLNYTALPWEFAKMGVFVRKFNRKMIMDLDDDLWDIQKDNPAYVAYHPNSQGIHDFNCIAAEVDAMTTTNSYLKNVIAHNTAKKPEQIKVFPNHVDFKLHSHRSPFKNDGQITLYHYGSTTHFVDLESAEFSDGVDRIFKEYPNAKLVTCGALLPKYKWRWGTRYEVVYGDPDMYKFTKEYNPRFMDQADIMVVPLDDKVYTRCKSNIKWTESSTFCKPGVYQDIRQYRECIVEGKTGFLAKTADQWYTAIKKMIDDDGLRKKIAQNAFKEVEKNWTIQSHLDDYAQYFIEELAR